MQRASPEEIAFVDVEITLPIRQEEEIKDLLKQQYPKGIKECQGALGIFSMMRKSPLK